MELLADDEVPLVEVPEPILVLSLKKFWAESEWSVVTQAYSSDIHTRAELSERILDDATLRRLSTMGENIRWDMADLQKNEMPRDSPRSSSRRAKPKPPLSRDPSRSSSD